MALVGCATVDEWGRGKVYRPTVVGDEAEWQRLLTTRADVSSFAIPVGAGDEQVTVIEVVAVPGQTSPVRVLYLHGTCRHAFQNLPKTAPMLRAGMDVVVPAYRGWGRSSPRLPSEASIYADAWAVWQALQTEARDTDQSPFTNFSDVAGVAAGWPGRCLVALGEQRMDAAMQIGDVAPPLWVMHGEADKTVPIRLGRRLFDLAPEPKHWAQWPLGHCRLHTDPSGRYDQTWQDIRVACDKP